MTEKEKKFIEDNFKAGEYAQCTILVKLKDLKTFMDVLQKSNLNLAVLPEVKQSIDFETEDKGMLN